MKRKIRACKVCSKPIELIGNRRVCSPECKHIALSQAQLKYWASADRKPRRASMKKMWSDPEEHASRVQAYNRPEVLAKKRASQSIAQRRPETNEKRKRSWKPHMRRKMAQLLASRNEVALKKRTSKLELRFVPLFEPYGFVNNVVVGKRYTVDFLNENAKLIVEIKGTYWHADPRTFKASDYISSLRTTAGGLWKRDEVRERYLQRGGYAVVSLWESDIESLGDNWAVNEVLKALDHG